jgi:hypothetical protein
MLVRLDGIDAESSDRNLRQHGAERISLASITAERQRRLDAVQKLWDEGMCPAEIGQRLGHRHTAIYHDLRALRIDPKQSTKATLAAEARERLLDRIAGLIESGLMHHEIAPIVELSTAMVSYHARRLVACGRLAQSSLVRKRRK